jgi:hypothetical protein
MKTQNKIYKPVQTKSDKLFNIIINSIYISGFITLMSFTIYNIINN